MIFNDTLIALRLDHHRPLWHVFRYDPELFAGRELRASRNGQGSVRAVGRGQVLLHSRVGRKLRKGAAQEGAGRGSHLSSTPDHIGQRGAGADWGVDQGTYLRLTHIRLAIDASRYESVLLLSKGIIITLWNYYKLQL